MPAGSSEQRQRLTRDEDEAAEVDPELKVDVLRLQVLDPSADADAGGVDEHVETAVALAVLGHEPHAILLVAHIGGDAVRAEVGGRLLDVRRGPRSDRQPVAVFGKHACDGEADAPGAAGDERAASHGGILVDA